jgi:hypothetical protein
MKSAGTQQFYWLAPKTFPLLEIKVAFNYHVSAKKDSRRLVIAQ